MLNLLCVDPEYQRSGAGTALMRWGTKIADERGVEVSFVCPELGDMDLGWV